MGNKVLMGGDKSRVQGNPTDPLQGKPGKFALSVPQFENSDDVSRAQMTSTVLCN